MTRLHKTIGNLAVALLLVGGVTGAHAQVAGGAFSGAGVSSRGFIHIQGAVRCVGCTIDEVRKAQPGTHHLYQLTYRQRPLVIQMQQVNSLQRWHHLAWPPRLGVRAADHVFQQLTMEANLFKTVEITGILRNSRTLDISRVVVQGEKLKTIANNL